MKAHEIHPGFFLHYDPEKKSVICKHGDTPVVGMDFELRDDVDWDLLTESSNIWKAFRNWVRRHFT